MLLREAQRGEQFGWGRRTEQQGPHLIRPWPVPVKLF